MKVDLSVVCLQDEDVKGGVWAGARPSYVTKENQRSADGQAPQCNEEAGRGRRLGAEKILRHWLV